METERLNVFCEQGQHIGTATRHEVHQLGLWHETFHCWFICYEQERTYLYFQIRSEQKLDYPSLLDITCAGHLLANETVEDGVREIEEELGIKLNFNELHSIGNIRYTLFNGEKRDCEMAHVFVYKFEGCLEDFKLQTDEVSGIVKIDLAHFINFWQTDTSTSITVEGFELQNGQYCTIQKKVGKHDFVQHGEQYFSSVLPKLVQI